MYLILCESLDIFALFFFESVCCLIKVFYEEIKKIAVFHSYCECCLYFLFVFCLLLFLFWADNINFSVVSLIRCCLQSTWS